MSDFVDRFDSGENVLRLADAQVHEDAPRDQISRADLIFYDVDHSRESFEARVFFNNPDADASTERTAGNGYAGSFHVFGHGRCVGGPGHCDPAWGAAEDLYDFRRHHHLEPHTRTVKVTDALKRAAEQGPDVRVTVVAVPQHAREEERPLLKFSQVRLSTYQ